MSEKSEGVRIADPSILNEQPIPYMCPVCGGTGQVQQGFYDPVNGQSTAINYEQCRSCQGSGVVWSKS